LGRAERTTNQVLRGPLPLAEALKTAIETASALEKAHRQGIVHRDLKPGNIMLTKAGAKLLDFGLAKQSPAGALSGAGATALPTMAAPDTAQGTILGTFQYMAPERIEGQEADARSDIFAFGVVLYEMVTGEKAFTGKTHASLISSILKDAPRPAIELQPLIPPLLDHIVSRCLAKIPMSDGKARATSGANCDGSTRAAHRPGRRHYRSRTAHTAIVSSSVSRLRSLVWSSGSRRRHSLPDSAAVDPWTGRRKSRAFS
jgi:serine/threonine protein kinase